VGFVNAYLHVEGVQECLTPCTNIDHKIEVVFGLTPLSKAFYRLNQEEPKRIKNTT